MKPTKKPKRKIVTIGGGNIAKFHTLKIDRRIVELTGKKNPEALFIPTASSDAVDYWGFFQRVYGRRLKCKTEVLFLIRQKPSKKEIRDKILSADLIYVGGGNTLKMMRLWRRLGVDKLLKKAWQKGTVMSGLSAGCLCWYDQGHSDSLAYYNPKKWHYIRVKGLGFITSQTDVCGCPHYDGEKRDTNFKKMIKKCRNIGIAIDNNCAVEYLDDTYRVIASKSGANAYKVTYGNGSVLTEPLKPSKIFKPQQSLFN